MLQSTSTERRPETRAFPNTPPTNNVKHVVQNEYGSKEGTSSAAAETRFTEIINKRTIPTVPTVKQKTKPHFKRETQRKVLHLILLFIILFFKLQKSHNLHLQMQKIFVHLHVV